MKISKENVTLGNEIVTENIGYQYDETEQVVLLEEGYKYIVYTLSREGKVVQSYMDLGGKD